MRGIEVDERDCLKGVVDRPRRRRPQPWAWAHLAERLRLHRAADVASRVAQARGNARAPARAPEPKEAVAHPSGRTTGDSSLSGLGPRVAALGIVQRAVHRQRRGSPPQRRRRRRAPCVERRLAGERGNRPGAGWVVWRHRSDRTSAMARGKWRAVSARRDEPSLRTRRARGGCHGAPTRGSGSPRFAL